MISAGRVLWFIAHFSHLFRRHRRATEAEFLLQCRRTLFRGGDLRQNAFPLALQREDETVIVAGFVVDGISFPDGAESLWCHLIQYQVAFAVLTDKTPKNRFVPAFMQNQPLNKIPRAFTRRSFSCCVASS